MEQTQQKKNLLTSAVIFLILAAIWAAKVILALVDGAMGQPINILALVALAVFAVADIVFWIRYAKCKH